MLHVLLSSTPDGGESFTSFASPLAKGKGRLVPAEQAAK
jgi:hypothetical protein